MLSARTIPGGWKLENVTVGSHVFKLLLPASPDDVFYHLEYHPESAAELGHDPYWAQLWPTSITLAQCVLQANWPRQERDAPLTAIELGCGVGLVGLAALSMGLQVTFSDYNPLAVELALENARLNGFSAAGLVLDWRDPPQRQYDVLLASDVIYDRALHQPLLDSLASLSRSDSRIWIGDGGRSSTEEFAERAKQQWKLDIVDVQGQPRPDIHVGEYRLLRFTRPSANPLAC